MSSRCVLVQPSVPTESKQPQWNCLYFQHTRACACATEPRYQRRSEDRTPEESLHFLQKKVLRKGSLRNFGRHSKIPALFPLPDY